MCKANCRENPCLTVVEKAGKIPIIDIESFKGGP